MHIKKIDLTYDEVSAKLIYDPVSGDFTWRVNPNRRYKAGDKAGAWKYVRDSKYLYLSVDGVQTPAARVAWLLTYGEWPNGNVLFRDDDSANIRINNLKLAEFPSDKVIKDGRRIYKMTREESHMRTLKRFYGITPQDYGAMVVSQKGVCAICSKPEMAVANGQVKPLSVDHNHTTGAVRELLCSSCNHMLGHAREDRNTLLSAIRYLDKHGVVDSNVTALAPKDTAQ